MHRISWWVRQPGATISPMEGSKKGNELFMPLSRCNLCLCISHLKERQINTRRHRSQRQLSETDKTGGKLSCHERKPWEAILGNGFLIWLQSIMPALSLGFPLLPTMVIWIWSICLDLQLNFKVRLKKKKMST